MGFWHTGYFEFHEPVGLDGFKAPPRRFNCLHCSATYSSLDQLRKHRFKTHPLRRPIMLLHGRELGTKPVRIRRRISPDDVLFANCEKAFLNHAELSISDLPQRLADVSSDICRVVLTKSGVEVEFTLDIRIASDADMAAIEEQFSRMARTRHLDTRAVERFILATAQFPSAIDYCDGICSYLYGVLAKERAVDSSLAYEAYRGKFNKAADELSDYDRPLARIIVSLIDFHYNHFRESAVMFPDSRVAGVAERFAGWMDGRRTATRLVSSVGQRVTDLESLVTDLDTEQIARWGIRPLRELSKDLDYIESFLKRDLAEFDKNKIRVLLGEIHALLGNRDHALEHAKSLRNLAVFGNWAETLIHKKLEANEQDV